MASKKRLDSRMSASRKLLPWSDRGRTNSRCSRGPAMQQWRESSPTRSKFVEDEEPSFVAAVGVPQRGGTCMRRMFTLIHRWLLSVATTHIPGTRSASARHLFKGRNCGNRELEDAAFCRKCSSVDRTFAVVTSVRRMSEVCSSPRRQSPFPEAIHKREHWER